jgi:uncharacterized protein YndB with AHSA1/START domain
MTLDPQRDLEITRIIKAPRQAVWDAWSQPEQFAKWWLPEPETCRVIALDLRPGGGLKTEMSQDGSFVPHMDACYLDVEPGRRIVFTNALTGGWRPAEQPFITAVITFDDHPDGTAYRAHVMHKDPETRSMHEELGFYDGWGTVADQLARLVEGR